MYLTDFWARSLEKHKWKLKHGKNEAAPVYSGWHLRERCLAPPTHIKIEMRNRKLKTAIA